MARPCPHNVCWPHLLASTGWSYACTGTFCFLHTMNQRGSGASKPGGWPTVRNLETVCSASIIIPLHSLTYSSLCGLFHAVQRKMQFCCQGAWRNPVYKCNDLQLLTSLSTKHDVWELYHLGVGRSPCSVLLPLLPAVAAAHSIVYCDKANVRLVFDLPTKQHTDNAGNKTEH